MSFTFNVGGGEFKDRTLLKKLNAGQYGEVPSQLMRWDKAGGKVVPGLKKRRENEVNLWNSVDRTHTPSGDADSTEPAVRDAEAPP